MKALAFGCANYGMAVRRRKSRQTVTGVGKAAHPHGKRMKAQGIFASATTAKREPRRRYVFDALERERAHGRIGLAAFGAACIYRAILEQANGRVLTSPPSEKQIRLFRKDAVIIEAMTCRAWAIEHQRFVVSELGADDEAFLRLFLLGNGAFSEVAEANGAATERQCRAIGRRFRQACMDLARAYGGYRADHLSSRQPGS
jgi:hypothetical protein